MTRTLLVTGPLLFGLWGCGPLLGLPDDLDFADSGESEGGSSTDGGGSDAASDHPTAPACAAGSVLCAGACVKGDDCASCAGAPLLCKTSRRCVAACAGCLDPGGAEMPIECFACDTSQKDPIGSCELTTTTTFCLSGLYSTAYKGGAGAHCDCNNTDVSNCPGAQQVCLPNGSVDWCVTCGEQGAPTPTDGRPCKGGGKCNTSLSPPRCQ